VVVFLGSGDVWSSGEVVGAAPSHFPLLSPIQLSR